MKRYLALLLTILVLGGSIAPTTVNAAEIVVAIGDRPYYRGPHYWHRHHRYVWVPGHWVRRHHHRIWIHGHYVRR